MQAWVAWPYLAKHPYPKGFLGFEKKKIENGEESVKTLYFQQILKENIFFQKYQQTLPNFYAPK